MSFLLKCQPLWYSRFGFHIQRVWKTFDITFAKFAFIVGTNTDWQFSSLSVLYLGNVQRSFDVWHTHIRCITFTQYVIEVTNYAFSTAGFHLYERSSDPLKKSHVLVWSSFVFAIWISRICLFCIVSISWWSVHRWAARCQLYWDMNNFVTHSLSCSSYHSWELKANYFHWDTFK